MNIRKCKICGQQIDFDEPWCAHETQEESALFNVPKVRTKIEVFIAYTDSTPPELLISTIYAWDTPEYEPIALHVKARKYDILRRVGAEAIAKNDYLIAELGTKPGDEIGIFTIKKGTLRVSECDPRT